MENHALLCLGNEIWDVERRGEDLSTFEGGLRGVEYDVAVLWK